MWQTSVGKVVEERRIENTFYVTVQIPPVLGVFEEPFKDWLAE